MTEQVLPEGPEHLDPAELARRFEEKKRLLEAAGVKPEVREVFRAAFKETAAEKMVPARPSAAPQATGSLSGASTDHRNDPRVADLVRIALEKGVAAAVRAAEAETPHLIDALHDELADHYYEKLIASGQLKPE